MRASILSPFLALCGVTFLSLAARGGTAEPPASFWTRDQASGDWLGARPALAEKGIVLGAGYAAEVFGNVTGGLRSGAVYDGLATASLDVDLEKFLGWSGATFRASGFYPHGSSLTLRYTGDLGGVSAIDFYDSVRLGELWLQQAFEFHSAAITLRAGDLYADTEFMVSPNGALFLNSGFGTNVSLTTNIPTPDYAIAAPAVRLDATWGKPEEHAWKFRAAAFDGNPAPGVYRDPSPDAAASREYNRNGLDWTLRSSEGALFIAETSLLFHQLIADSPEAKPDAKNVKPAIRGLAGTYSAGAIYATDTFSSIYDVQLANLGSTVARPTARAKQRDNAFYLSGDQELWREIGSDTDGLSAFARAMVTPRDRNLVHWDGEAGLVYRGLWQRDGRDALGLAFALYDLSGAVADATRAANLAAGTHFPLPTYESVLELTYKWQITPWWTVQPDLQWVRHPDGSDARNDALAIGFQSAFTF